MPHVNSKTPRRLLVYWGPPLIWAVMLMLLGRDKLAHAAFFGMMAVLVFRALRYGHHWLPVRAAAAAFLIACLYGGMDELAQRQQLTRNADLADFAADAVGASVIFLAPLFRLPPPREPTVST